MLDPSAVADRLYALAPGAARFIVALSGGRDSVALLHALATVRQQLPGPLTALHVDHGLHPQAGAWAHGCARLCKELGVPFELRRVSVHDHGGEGLEAAARRARYEAFSEEMGIAACLVLAHHAEDQAETLLLRALRGGGLHGLSAMPPVRPLGRGWLARPLLATSRAAVTAYAREYALSWVEDPANQEKAYDRVYLRRQVLPALTARWPQAAASIAAGAEALQADRALLAAYLDGDLAASRAGDGRPAVAYLRGLAPRRRQAVVRRWLEVAGYRPPPYRQLVAGLQDLLAAGADRTPELVWEEGCIRRYRGRLWLIPAEEPEPAGPSGRWSWSAEQALTLPGGTLSAAWTPAFGIDPALAASGVMITFRAGINSAAARRRAQRLFQALRVPPWQRAARPLLWWCDRPVAVAGYGAAREAAAAPGWRLRWEPATG
ncbi:MAG: tRNA lysidine(34) synthetase TilS [Halorhodospira sp.]